MYSVVKRSTDILIAGGVLVAMSPLWIAISVVIGLTSGFPILYHAQRLGKDGALFTMYKFCTMRGGQGPGITGAGDPRVTSVGRVLRQWKLDELPQLVNVILGDMSLIGPRPEDPRYLESYSLRQRAVLSVRPGITGPTQILFRHEERLLRGPDIDARYRSWLLPKKLDVDLGYVENQSVVSDFGYLFKTLVSLFRSSGEFKMEDAGPEPVSLGDGGNA